MKYITGFNEPGYMPDSEPIEFDNFDDAHASLLDELENAADIAFNSDDDLAGKDCEDSKEEAEQWTATPQQTGESWGSPESRYWQTYCDGYVYWIVAED